jgi:hypothetical protein
VILERFGFVDSDGVAYTFEWAYYSLLYSFSLCVLAVLASSIFLSIVRFATGKSLSSDSDEDEEEDVVQAEAVAFPFQKVDLTFRDIRYTVTSSVGNEQIELLKGIDGIVKSGKMTALVCCFNGTLVQSIVRSHTKFPYACRWDHLEPGKRR